MASALWPVAVAGTRRAIVVSPYRQLLAYEIKLEKGSDPAPRLHFWDDTGGRTSRIFVGYLGRHLPSFDMN